MMKLINSGKNIMDETNSISPEKDADCFSDAGACPFWRNKCLLGIADENYHCTDKELREEKEFEWM